MFLPAPIQAEVIATGMPAFLLGINSLGDAFYINEDGEFRFIPIKDIRTHWRWVNGRWIDLLEEEDATQDDPIDGSESVSGSVPDIDDVSESDPIDSEGRQTPGDTGDLDAGEDQ